MLPSSLKVIAAFRCAEFLLFNIIHFIISCVLSTVTTNTKQRLYRFSNCGQNVLTMLMQRHIIARIP
jgi:hypothetical protein